MVYGRSSRRHKRHMYHPYWCDNPFYSMYLFVLWETIGMILLDYLHLSRVGHCPHHVSGKARKLDENVASSSPHCPWMWAFGVQSTLDVCDVLFFSPFCVFVLLMGGFSVYVVYLFYVYIHIFITKLN